MERLSFELLAAVVYGLNKLCGNAPFTYDPRRQRFETSVSHIIYPTLLTCLYVSLHAHYYWQTLTSGSLMHRLLICSRYALVVAALAMNAVVHRRRMVRHLNASRQTLLHIGGVRTMRYGRAVVRVAVNIFVAGALTLYGSFGMFDVTSLGNSRRWNIDDTTS